MASLLSYMHTLSKLFVQDSKLRCRVLWPEPSVWVDSCVHSHHIFRVPSSDISNKRTFDPCDRPEKKICLWLIGPVERSLPNHNLLNSIRISLQTILPQRKKLEKSRTVRVKRLVPYPWKFKANDNCDRDNQSFFFSPTDAQLDSLKNNFNFALKLTLKSSYMFRCKTPSSGSTLSETC
jgi:hypothetical protein